jgi:uncharacterized protein YvpB
MKLTVTQDAIFRQSVSPAEPLPEIDHVSVKAKTVFRIHSWKSIDKTWLKVSLLGQFLGTPPRNTWYVPIARIQLQDDRGKIILPKADRPRPSFPAIPGLIPREKRLNVPYLSQRDNVFNPTGACNVTSYAMVMRYFQVARKTNQGQLEDELYSYMERNRISRHDPQDLAEMGRNYGLTVNFTSRASLGDIRRAIAQGQPCIVHGYFTSFGHIIVIRGYDKDGFIVNDPYGQWTNQGYRKGQSGEALHYSNDVISSKCSPEGDNFIWLHKLSKR